MKLFSDAAKAAIESGEVVVSGAVEIIQSDGSPFRAWGGDGPLTLGEHTYVGLGSEATVRASSGALGDAAQNVALTYSGVDPEVAAAVQLGLLRRAAAVVRRLIFDGAGHTLLDAHVFSRGRVDTAERNETPGGTATLTANVEGSAKSLGRAGGRMRTFEDQLLIDAGATGFRRVSFAGQVMLFWGGKIPASAAQVANAGLVTGPGVIGGGPIGVDIGLNG